MKDFEIRSDTNIKGILLERLDLFFVLFAASLITFLYYGSFLDNYFAWDSYWILDNNVGGSLKENLLGYRSLRLFLALAFMVLYKFSALDPVGYSLASILIHIANSVLLYYFMRLFSQNKWFASLSALIFALSSIGCDALFWKVALATPVNFLFYLSILICYVKFRQSGVKRYQRLALILFAVAMFNKEEIASLPFIILLLEILFFKGEHNIKFLFRVAFPFALIIVVYLLLSFAASTILNIQQEQFERLFRFRPLHSLLSGFTSFFISPKGFLSSSDPGLYIFLLFVPFSFYLVRDKRYLFLGYAWVFFSFLPQSFSMVTTFEPKYLFNSISRHAYLPSAGAAIVIAFVLISIYERGWKRSFFVISVIFFSVFMTVNYNRVQERGHEWTEIGVSMKTFLTMAKEVVAEIKGRNYIYVLNPPEGRSYISCALRGFYKNRDLIWVDDPNKKWAELADKKELKVFFYDPAKPHIYAIDGSQFKYLSFNMKNRTVVVKR